MRCSAGCGTSATPCASTVPRCATRATDGPPQPTVAVARTDRPGPRPPHRRRLRLRPQPLPARRLLCTAHPPRALALRLPRTRGRPRRRQLLLVRSHLRHLGVALDDYLVARNALVDMDLVAFD